jgi:conjugative transfer signal peptidase TraF
MRLARLRVLVLVGVVAAAASASAALVAARLVWNDTASVPLGLYLRRPMWAVAVGRTVILPIPASVRTLVAARRYLPLDHVLMKVVVALPGDRVCLDGHDYRVNGQLIAPVRAADSRGRTLDPYLFCGDVPAGQAFVATPAPLSFDSRYFGPVPLATLTVVRPLWTYSH